MKLRMNRVLPCLWGFVSGLVAMGLAWIYCAHNELTCPQKTVIILLSILGAIGVAVSLTLLRELKHGPSQD